MTESTVSLAEVVGRNARRLRGDATADQLARAARQEGLNWGTGRISDLEHGRVSPTLWTLVALALALGSVHNRPVTLADLVEHDGYISLTSSLAVKPAALQRFLRGEPVVVVVDDVPPDPERDRRISEALSPENRAAYRAELPPVVKTVSSDLWLRVLRQSGEAEARMAKAVGIHEENFAAVSAYLWGRTLSAERNNRAGAAANAQERGRVTRQLKAEIRAVLDGNHQ